MNYRHLYWFGWVALGFALCLLLGSVKLIGSEGGVVFTMVALPWGGLGVFAAFTSNVCKAQDERIKLLEQRLQERDPAQTTI